MASSKRVLDWGVFDGRFQLQPDRASVLFIIGITSEKEALQEIRDEDWCYGECFLVGFDTNAEVYDPRQAKRVWRIDRNNTASLVGGQP